MQNLSLSVYKTSVLQYIADTEFMPLSIQNVCLTIDSSCRMFASQYTRRGSVSLCGVDVSYAAAVWVINTPKSFLFSQRRMAYLCSFSRPFLAMCDFPGNSLVAGLLVCVFNYLFYRDTSQISVLNWRWCYWICYLSDNYVIGYQLYSCSDNIDVSFVLRLAFCVWDWSDYFSNARKAITSRHSSNKYAATRYIQDQRGRTSKN